MKFIMSKGDVPLMNSPESTQLISSRHTEERVNANRNAVLSIIHPSIHVLAYTKNVSFPISQENNRKKVDVVNLHAFCLYI